EQRLDARRRRRIPERALERSGTVPFAAPVVDAFGEPRLPLLDVLCDDRRDVGDESQELTADARRRRAAALFGEVAEDRQHLLGCDLLAAQRLKGDQSIEPALELAHVLELDSPHFIDHARPEAYAALLALRLEDRHA